MAALLTTLVWENFPRGGNDKLVALCLADWANDDGEIQRISNQAVARKTGLSLRTVQRSIHTMTDLGWLQVAGAHVGGRGVCASYRMDPGREKGDKLTPFKTTKKACQDDTLSGGRKPVKSKSKPKASKVQKGVKLSPKDIYISFLTGEGAGLDLREDTWLQYVEHRELIKKPLTPRAALLALRHLRDMEAQGEEPWRVINQSIFRRWVGLFPVKEAQKETPPTRAMDGGASGGTTLTQRGKGYGNRQQNTTRKLSAADEVRLARLSRGDGHGSGRVFEGIANHEAEPGEPGDTVGADGRVLRKAVN